MGTHTWFCLFGQFTPLAPFPPDDFIVRLSVRVYRAVLPPYIYIYGAPADPQRRRRSRSGLCKAGEIRSRGDVPATVLFPFPGSTAPCAFAFRMGDDKMALALPLPWPARFLAACTIYLPPAAHTYPGCARSDGCLLTQPNSQEVHPRPPDGPRAQPRDRPWELLLQPPPLAVLPGQGAAARPRPPRRQLCEAVQQLSDASAVCQPLPLGHAPLQSLLLRAQAPRLGPPALAAALRMGSGQRHPRQEKSFESESSGSDPPTPPEKTPPTRSPRSARVSRDAYPPQVPQKLSRRSLDQHQQQQQQQPGWSNTGYYFASVEGLSPPRL